MGRLGLPQAGLSYAREYALDIELGSAFPSGGTLR